MTYTRFESFHTYARKNGYKGSYTNYVALQYRSYVQVCKHCDIKPLSYHQWIGRQTHE